MTTTTPALNCEDDSGACGDNATCVNISSGIECICKEGFSSPGSFYPPMPSTCFDTDECKTDGLHECVNAAGCINTVGSYNCTCPAGYYENGLKESGRQDCKACNRSDEVDHMFGLNCSQPCTCATNAGCAIETGICTGDNCGNQQGLPTCDKNDLIVTVTTTSPNGEVQEGNFFEVTCSVNLLSTDVMLSWTGPNGEVIVPVSGKYSIRPVSVPYYSEVLQVLQAHSTDTGMYNCTATLRKLTDDVIFRTDSVHITVLVQGKIVSELPEEKKGVRGSNLTLTCVAFGIPPPTAQWLFMNESAGDTFANAFVSEGVVLWKRTANLTFYNLNKNNSGVYTCQVKMDSTETDLADVTLIVVDLPEIANFRVISSTSTSLTLIWTIKDNGSDTLTCRANYTARGSLESKVENCIGNETCWLLGLPSYTVYDVTVECRNAAGYSNPLTASERTDTSGPSAPRNPTVESSPEKCVVNWDHSESPNGPDLSYEVTQFIRDSSSGDLDENPGRVKVESDTKYELQKADMILNSEYTFRICANNADHRGDCADASGSCMTNPGAPDSIPTIGTPDQETAVNISSVILTVPEVDDRNGPISCYEFVVVKRTARESGGGSPDDVQFEEIKSEPENDSPYRSVVMNHAEYMMKETVTIGSNANTITRCRLGVSSSRRRKRSNMVDGGDLVATNAPLDSRTNYDIFLRCYSETSGGMFQYASSEYVSVTTTGGDASTGLIVFLAIFVLLIIAVSIAVFLVCCRKGSQDKSKSDRVKSAVYANDGVPNEPIGYSSIELDSMEATSPSDYHHLHQGQHGETMTEYDETEVSMAERRVSGSQYEDVSNSQPGRRNLPNPPAGPQTNSAIQFEYHDYEEPGDFEKYTGVYINIPDTHHLFSPEPIKVSEFQSFMRKDKMQLVEGIVQEFMILPKGRQYPCFVAQQHCQQRNNFQEILPYDHSRVVLTSLGNMNESDYYNASYIKDHKGKICFIAAQGPRNKYKASDFWRMIWQEQVKTIVMLTDSNQAKPSAAYWPEKVQTNETYGKLTVLGMESTSYGTHTVRKIKVLQNDVDRIHTVQQIQLHVWPFRGVPEDISDLIAVIKKVKALQEGDTAGPLLVHCSNGSGATGTFIAIYSLMDVLKEGETISVFDFVNNMRKDRMVVVQTRIQYLFIYQTLQEAQLFPEDSSLSCGQLKNLSDKILNEKAQKEFKVLRKMDENSRQTKSGVGRLATNAHKNRFKGIIPLDKYRATLKSEGLTRNSSDYINASIAENNGSGYVLMAQSPLSATVEDFWRLVYHYQCRTVIMLDNANNIDKTFVQYWPDGRAVHASITVDLVTSMKFDTFTKRTFTVTHQDFKESVSVEQLVYDGLEKKQDIDVNKLAKFIISTQTDRSKTLVVHCINGVGLSAVYVVVRSLMESVKNGDECDIFLAVQKLRMKIPHAIQTQDEYILCLQLLRSTLNNEEDYVVVY
ncbi:Receptor-type tyrosine-protein phosphatase epsilon [Holothuria leucospilota]|uniref:protein-tyrosine-phosphatase n=1 Tax=Holothuria leucospilota TaxID=206669 RepID=A0A9Q1C9W8_HOLLE|nr:Receptor-type tyrosine-protein phosphatase epsilon [Holothuria leucospilota]